MVKSNLKLSKNAIKYSQFVKNNVSPLWPLLCLQQLNENSSSKDYNFMIFFMNHIFENYFQV